MKSMCFLKECDNFNEDFDCILHYSKIQHEAIQRIIMHYNAMRLRMDEILNENNKFETEVKKKSKNQFDAIYKVIKKRSDDGSSMESFSSAISPSKLNKSTSSNGSQSSSKKIPENGKENSPRKIPHLRSSTRSSSGMSIDPNPVKEKRTKQTKLPFFTTSSAKKRRSNEPDEDMTFCAEIEKKGTSPADNQPSTSGVFKFEDRTSPSSKLEQTPPKVLGIQIKQEKEDSCRKPVLPPISPDLFSSDVSSQSNSVIFLEPSEKEVISIPDRSSNSAQELIKELEKEIKEPRKKRLFEDSFAITTVKKEARPEPTIKTRDQYKGECFDCEIFYDDLAQEKGLNDANNAINACPIKCDGWKERCKKLNSRKTGVTVLKCNSKFARRRKEDSVNVTAPGFWDLHVEPRKNKPLFSKNDNYETPDL